MALVRIALAAAQGAQPAQDVAAHGGLDPVCKYIVGGLALAVLGMAAYIVKQHVAERAILRDWIRSMQDSKSLLDLVGEVNRNKPAGGE
jgi:Na+/H+-translocating membrane pyrophosphatase